MSFTVHCEWCIEFLKFHHDHCKNSNPQNLPHFHSVFVCAEITQSTKRRAFLLSFMSVAMGYIKVDGNIVGGDSYWGLAYVAGVLTKVGWRGRGEECLQCRLIGAWGESWRQRQFSLLVLATFLVVNTSLQELTRPYVTKGLEKLESGNFLGITWRREGKMKWQGRLQNKRVDQGKLIINEIGCSE